MELYWPYLLADYIRVVEYVAAVVAVIILISSIDDLFIDAWYWGRRIYRRFVIEPFIRPLTPAMLYQKDEQPLAIMIPAWLESPVIAAMIENMVSVLDYRRYTIFVGTYPNDPETIAEVERMRRRYKQLVRVETRNPGPTNKADCLNAVVRAIFQHEQMTGVEFAGLVLHDAEDVLHPLELRYFSLHSPSGVSFEVKIACIRALDKDFLPQAAPAVAQTAGSGRIRPRSRCFLAQGRRFSAQRTDLSSRFRSV